MQAFTIMLNFVYNILSFTEGHNGVIGGVESKNVYIAVLYMTIRT